MNSYKYFYGDRNTISKIKNKTDKRALIDT